MFQQNANKSEFTHLQIVQSDPDDPDSLVFCASEEKMVGLLNICGLWNKISASASSLSSLEIKEDVNNNNNNNNNMGQYSIISIMGPQSSGKSTLLNYCFGCQFAIMDAKKGKNQTTTGIWLGPCNKAKNLIIMDLEGTDSSQRGRNRVNFERQTSLMALALSEVLMINMNVTDIGRADGMNVETLRSILEANLRLFLPNSKTLLLFIIRDQPSNESQLGATPAKQLERQILELVNKIWNEISKSNEYKNVSLSNLFDIDFYFIPDFRYEKECFYKSVEELFGRFTNPNNSKYYFRTQYRFKKSVPAEGFYEWTKHIWEAIITDELLNIPDQQKLLAEYRCENASQKSYTNFQSLCETVEAELRRGEVKKFGERLNEIIKTCVKIYESTARKYDSEISGQKRLDLMEKIETKVLQLFTKQQEYINRRILSSFAKKLNNILPKDKCCDNFENVIDTITEEYRKIWSDQINASIIDTENENLQDKDKFGQNFHGHIRKIIKEAQTKQCNLLYKEFEQAVEDDLAPFMAQIFLKPSENIWKELEELRETFQDSLDKILEKLQKLRFGEEDKNFKEEQLRSCVDRLFLECCRKFGNEFYKVMERYFDDRFKRTPDGVPRDWDSRTKMQSEYAQIRNNTLSLLNIITEFELKGDEKLPSIEEKLIDLGKLEDIKGEFERHAENEYQDAQGRLHQYERQSIWPTHPLQWLIFLFFAWNEIWNMITNPLSLLTSIGIAAILFVAYQIYRVGNKIPQMILRYTVNQMVSSQQKHENTFLPSQNRNARSNTTANTINISGRYARNI